MSIENTNRWRQCTLKIDNPVEIFVRTPIQPIEQQAACRWEGNDGDDDDHNYDDMIMVMVMTTITMMQWWWWQRLKFSWESGSDEPSNKPPLCLTDKLNSCHIMVGCRVTSKIDRFIWLWRSLFLKLLTPTSLSLNVASRMKRLHFFLEVKQLILLILPFISTSVCPWLQKLWSILIRHFHH